MRPANKDSRPLVAITAGDVAGIGPEVVARACADSRVHRACRVLVLCHPRILHKAAQLAGLSLQIAELQDPPSTRSELERRLAAQPHHICCWNPADDAVASESLVPHGTVSAAAGEAAFQYLTAAIQLAQQQIVDAIATAPLNKESLHAAGHPFPGHTEILAARCNVSDFAMMLYLPDHRLQPLRQLIGQHDSAGRQPTAATPVAAGLSINHVTLHTSVRSVPPLLSTEAISEKIELLHQFLTQLGVQRKAIGVCALNPHGGEHGLFGDEESQIIEPAVQAAAERGRNVAGPFPVDTLVRRAVAGEFDGLVAMYHDQGHIPVKLIGFDAAVNITLGLPIIRTSPTHGTAFDRAWNSDTPADPAGMVEAILTAVKLHHGQA